MSNTRRIQIVVFCIFLLLDQIKFIKKVKFFISYFIKKTYNKNRKEILRRRSINVIETTIQFENRDKFMSENLIEYKK